MKSTDVYNVIRQIGDNSKTTIKQTILNENIGNELFKTCLVYALDPTKVFGIVPKLEWLPDQHSDNDFDEITFTLLDDLVNRNLTGHAARDAIIVELSRLNNESALLLIDIIKKDLRGGFGDTLTNKAHKDLIPEYCYMRCSVVSKIKSEKFNWKKGVYSECLDYNWQLLADDGKYYKIGDIVENKLQLNVLTVDSGNETYKPITAYFENEIQDDDEWYTISYYKDGAVITTPPLTDNHKVILEDCREVYVRDLQSGDFLWLSSVTSNGADITK